METEEAGLDVIRAARQQPYDPATALLTAYPPAGWEERRADGDALHEDGSHSLLIKPLGTGDLLRQVEALLVSHADRQEQRRNAGFGAQQDTRRMG
jgi:DNA-binding response OmpR family regulator